MAADPISQSRSRADIWIAVVFSLLLSTAAIGLWSWNWIAPRLKQGVPSPPTERVVDAPGPDNEVKSGTGTPNNVEKTAPGPDNSVTRLAPEENRK